jgi:hypothetical protein
MKTARCWFVPALCVAGILGAQSGYALYMKPQLEQVPVAKLVENLEKAIKDKPNSVTLRYNLARVHAMAYALKTDEAQVNKLISPTTLWFSSELPKPRQPHLSPNERIMPFTPKAATDKAALKAAMEHLDKAIKRYQETVLMAPDNLAARLGLAWVTEQSGNKEKAIAQYRDVIERGWKKKGQYPGTLVAAEAAGYLVRLLDGHNDRDEIDRLLKERNAALRERAISPIAIPLRNGVTARDLEDPTASVAFDADGTGLAQRWTWITKDAGWLVYDHTGKGKVTSGLQLFGNVTFWLFWEHGYEAMAALDDNGDGALTGEELRHLAVWVDRNGDGIVQPGEIKTLTELKIVALSCRHERDSSHPDRIAWSPNGVVFRDGSTRPTYDLVLHRR